MSTNSPRRLAVTALAALALFISACSGAATETTTTEDVVGLMSPTQAAGSPTAEELEKASGETEAVPEVLGQTEEPADAEESAEALSEDPTEPEVRLIDEAASNAAAERNAVRAREVLASMIALIESTDPVPIIDPADLIEEESATEIDAVDYAIVGVDWGLNVRSGTSSDTELVTQVEKDRILSGTGLQDGEWVEIEIDGTIGWVRLEFLVETNAVETVEPTPVTPTPEGAAVEEPVTGPSTPNDSTSEPEPSPETPLVAEPTTLIVIDVTTSLNLRGGPGAASDVVGSVPVGESVTATGNATNVWTEVTYDGVTGWARSDRLQAATEPSR